MAADGARPLRVAVTGATGNVGTAVLSALSAEPAVESIVGIARRRPRIEVPKVEWCAANVVTDARLPEILAGADVVIHLAWLIQPSRDQIALRAVNVEGSRRVFETAAEAGVPAIVYASSVGAYSPGPKHESVDESWPTEGVDSSFYSRHKAEVEAILDGFEGRNPEIRVVRLRPALIFRREAATGIRRLFLGPLFPNPLLGAGVPVVPEVERLRFQAVHTADVAEAYRLAVLRDVSGPFNIAAEPVLDPAELARILHARRVPVPARALRGAAAVSWRLHLQPSPPGWVDMALAVPIMSTARARSELGWQPRHTAAEALGELLEGLRDGTGYPTPPLDPGTSGPLRKAELSTGVGERG
jgi:UDP-glucose 4-epimerase